MSTKRTTKYRDTGTGPLRLYTFVNFYYSSIQQGIQSAHVVSDLFTEYTAKTKAGKILIDWAENHKTMIVLNGGMYSDLINDSEALYDCGVHELFPMTHFIEEPDAVGGSSGVMTAWGIVLPESIYSAKPVYEKVNARRTGAYESGVIGVNHKLWSTGSVEALICEILEKKPLAR
jgi:hypothetical protein